MISDADIQRLRRLALDQFFNTPTGLLLWDAVNEIIRLRAALTDLLNGIAVELDDDRLEYVTAQIDRRDLADARQTLKEIQ